MMNHAFIIAFLLIHTKVTWFYQWMCSCTWLSCMCSNPPTQWPSIYIISTAVLRTDHLLYTLTCPLELICTPTVPLLQGHATTVSMGSEARQVLKPPPPAPCMAKRKRPVAPRAIQWGYQIPIEGACALHGSSGLQHGELPWPFFQDLNCRKTVFPTFACPARGLEDEHTVQKVRPICPQHGRGSKGDWDSRASQWTKTNDIVGQTYDIVCQHTMSMIHTPSYVTLRYRIPHIRYRMSKNVPMISYTIWTYDVVCK